MNRRVRKERKIFVQDLGEKGDRNKMVAQNIGLAYAQANRFAVLWEENPLKSFDDLLQVACIGLIKAADRFDPSSGYQFSSFAVPYIRGEILHYLRDKADLVKIPRKIQDLYRRAVVLREGNDSEIAATLGVSQKDLQDARGAVLARKYVKSLDAPVLDDPDRLSLVDLLLDVTAQDKALDLETRQAERQELLDHISQLDEPIKSALDRVFFQGMNYTRAAQVMGLVPITVSRRCRKGVKALSTAFSFSDS